MTIITKIVISPEGGGSHGQNFCLSSYRHTYRVLPAGLCGVRDRS